MPCMLPELAAGACAALLHSACVAAPIHHEEIPYTVTVRPQCLQKQPQRIWIVLNSWRNHQHDFGTPGALEASYTVEDEGIPVPRRPRKLQKAFHTVLTKQGRGTYDRLTAVPSQQYRFYLVQSSPVVASGLCQQTASPCPSHNAMDQGICSQ